MAVYGTPFFAQDFHDSPFSAAVLDLEPKQSEFQSEVMAGLAEFSRTLPCNFFYDKTGAELFQKGSRESPSIHHADGAEDSASAGPGNGDAPWTRSGVDWSWYRRRYQNEDSAGATQRPCSLYSGRYLQRAARPVEHLISHAFPTLEILPVCADYLQPIRLPSAKRKAARKIVYFPGSTIGNFEPAPALEFLKRIAALCGPGGGLLIGVDLQKKSRDLEAAYNDARGVTAKFNLNLLARINRELHGNFVLAGLEASRGLQ